MVTERARLGAFATQNEVVYVFGGCNLNLDPFKPIEKLSAG